MQGNLSLPRIRPAEYISAPIDIIKEQPLKFKKLRLNESQQQANIGIPPLKQNRTERSYSVAAGLSAEERKNLKTQRINVSLAEKKMREGNYYEEQQVGSDLSSLKRSCSQYNTEINSKSTLIQILKNKIDGIRNEIALQNNDSDAIAMTVQMRREKYTALKSKCEEMLYQKSRLQNMIRELKIDNITMLGRVEENRYELTKIKKYLNSMTRTELEVRDRQNEAEGKYKSAADELQISSRQNRRRLDEQQMKIKKFADNETNRDDRKKKLINISTSVVEEERDRVFHKNYNSFLANKALNRFLEDRMNRLIETNQRILYLFRQANESYGPFTPSEFTAKFQNQQPERENITKEAKRLESTITQLESHQRKLNKESVDLQIEFLSLGQQLDNKNQKQNEADAVDQQFYEKSVQAEGKVKVINQWSDKSMRKIENVIFDKKSRTQNIAAISPIERLKKIMQYIRSWTIDHS